MPGRYLLDTNIMLLLIKRASFGVAFEEAYRSQPDVFLGYSYATLGELDSLTRQNQWGPRRLGELVQLLRSFQMVPLAGQALIEQYGKVDAYSQGRLAEQPLPTGLSARNMGKNDLWIAASAATLGATLITADRDFDHLSPDFFAIDWVDISAF
ncbi:MAG: PIN domain-containing protein [Bacteroidia bacterium]|nr:PIN domain-containing protein [Bacteroidia bacterium]